MTVHSKTNAYRSDVTVEKRSRSNACSLVVMDPFTCIVAGPTGCGKTMFVARLLRNASVMIDSPPEQVTWYYGQWKSAYESLDIPKLRLDEGLPKSFDTGKRNVVVLDDLMAETDGCVTQLFTKKSHHSNTSAIYLVQNLFPKHKESRTISLNAQYMVVFKNPRDASQVTHLAKQMYPGREFFFPKRHSSSSAHYVSYPYSRMRDSSLVNLM